MIMVFHCSDEVCTTTLSTICAKQIMLIGKDSQISSDVLIGVVLVHPTHSSKRHAVVTQAISDIFVSRFSTSMKTKSP